MQFIKELFKDTTVILVYLLTVIFVFIVYFAGLMDWLFTQLAEASQIEGNKNPHSFWISLFYFYK